MFFAGPWLPDSARTDKNQIPEPKGCRNRKGGIKNLDKKNMCDSHLTYSVPMKKFFLKALISLNLNIRVIHPVKTGSLSGGLRHSRELPRVAGRLLMRTSPNANGRNWNSKRPTAGSRRPPPGPTRWRQRLRWRRSSTG